MSASPMARQVESKSIPIKKVYINDSSELPSHYSSTPGGTLYSTTPGGNFLNILYCYVIMKIVTYIICRIKTMHK